MAAALGKKERNCNHLASALSHFSATQHRKNNTALGRLEAIIRRSDFSFSQTPACRLHAF
jgi:hypothetical protein